MEFLHTVENTLTVGIPTSGCSLGANHIDFYLPNTGLRLYFGTGLSFNETMENRDGVGYLPRPVGQPRRGPGGGGPAVRVLWPEGAGFVGAAALSGPPRSGSAGRRAFPARRPAAPGEQTVDEQGHGHPHAGVQHAVERVRDVVVRADGEQQQAEHHPTGLYGADPEDLGQQNQDDDTAEEQGHQQQVASPSG